MNRRKVNSSRQARWLAWPLAFSLGALACVPANCQDVLRIVATGSGFVISSQGHMVTNHHVVDGCKSVAVTIGEHTGAAEIVASDKQNDLALLKLAATTASPTPLALRSDQRLRLGENVLVAGFPLQGIGTSTMSLTTGTVSALAGLGEDTRMVQFTAPIQPGNSGGPLLDQSGNVVGIVASKLSALWTAKNVGDIPQNVNFAIKSSVIEDFLDSRGVKYTTARSVATMESTGVAEKAGLSVALVACLGDPDAETAGVSKDFPAGPLSNRRAPGFSLPDPDYTHFYDLQDYRGKVVLIDIMSTSCPHCLLLSSTLEMIKARYGDQVAILSVVLPPDNRDTITKYRAVNRVTVPIVCDMGQMTVSYMDARPGMGHIDVPHLFIVDQQGMIRNDFSYQQSTRTVFEGPGLIAQIDRLMH
jgi:S1-C subfamily serine protease